MRLWLALLALTLCAAHAKKVAIVMDAVEDAHFKDAMLKGCREHLFNAHHAGSQVTVFYRNEWVLTWTPVENKELIERAIKSIELRAEKSTWVNGFAEVLKNTRDATHVVFITNYMPHTLRPAIDVTITLRQKMQATIFPIGIGSGVREGALKMIAGPCDAAVGCSKNVNFVVGSVRMPPAIATATTTTTTKASTEAPAKLAMVSGHVYLHDSGVEKRRGYAGIGIELIDSAGRHHLSTSDSAGQVHFEDVATGMASLQVGVPPGMELIGSRAVKRQLDIRSDSQNRLPPIELRFDAHHKVAVEHISEERVAEPLSGGDIAIIVVASLLGLLFLIVLIWYCWRVDHKDPPYDPLEPFNGGALQRVAPAPQKNIISLGGNAGARFHGLRKNKNN